MFSFGHLTATKNVAELMGANNEFDCFVRSSLLKYREEDWGDTCKEDARQNDYAARNKERILAVYKFPEGCSWTVAGEDAIWIITELDRSATTILFPGEY
jgi:hypothetical protein